MGEMGHDGLRLIVCNESDAKSVASDIFSVVSLIAPLWVNHELLGNSSLVIFTICVCWFFSLVSRANSKIKRMNGREALAYLKQKYEAA